MLPDPFFVDEARENLDLMESSLLGMGARGGGQALIDSIFRCAHSIKGGAAAFGLNDLADMLHQAESLLHQWRRDRREPDSAGVALLIEAVTLARRQLSGEAQHEQALSDLTTRLQEAVGPDVPGPLRRRIEVILISHDRPSPGEIVPELFRDIVGLGEIIGQPQTSGGSLVYTVTTDASEAELQDLLAIHMDRDQFLVRAAPVPLVMMPAEVVAGSTRSSTVPSIRVTLAELDGIGRISSCIEEAGLRLVDKVGAAEPEIAASWATDLAQLHAYQGQLQRAILEMRTAPVSSVFEPASRLLPGLSTQLGKLFRLEMAGGAVRVDRLAAQSLVDIVIHLVRNCCDHGIEAPSERLVVGKPGTGVIGLDATARDGVVRIVVRDDGRGLSREKLLPAARAFGLEVSEDMPDHALWQLVFVPGFSTVNVVSQVSGRGVGMDLVSRKVADMGGVVRIESHHGVGTRVTIDLPPLRAGTASDPV